MTTTACASCYQQE